MIERREKVAERQIELPYELTLGDFLNKLNSLVKSREFKTYMVEFDVQSAPSSVRNEQGELIETTVTKPVVIEKADAVEPVTSGSYLLVNEDAKEMYLVRVSQSGLSFEWSHTSSCHATVSRIQWLDDLETRPSLLKEAVAQAELEFDRREEWEDEEVPPVLKEQINECSISGEDEFLSLLVLSLTAKHRVATS